MPAFRGNVVFIVSVFPMQMEAVGFSEIIIPVYKEQWRTQEFCSVGGGGFQQIKLKTEDRENGDLGAVAP